MNILHVALHKIYEHINTLVGESLEGNISKKSLAKLRACLPEQYEHSFRKKKK